MNVLNLTTHKIVVYAEDHESILKTYEPHGFHATLESEPQKVEEELSKKYEVPISTCQSFTSCNMPTEDILKNADAIIVSMPVGQHLAQKLETSSFEPTYDILGPDMGPKNRVDGENGPKGTTRLNVYVKSVNPRKRKNN